MSDPFDLQRFVEAQSPMWSTVCWELRQGRKQTHWMWFVFPQIEGLGHSPMAERFSLSSTAEAQAYLRHPVLGPRLIECTETVNSLKNATADSIFGYPDNLKFRSSMTLFAEAAPEIGAFQAALDKYFHGEPDPLTLANL